MAGSNDDSESRVDFVEIDTATYVAASFYGPVVLPLNIPFAQAAAIAAQANFAQRLEGSDDLIVGGTGGIPIADRSKAERQRQADDEAFDYLTFMSEEADHQREEEHELQWRQSSHTYAGETLTGEEWHSMISWFRDDANVAAWEQAMMAETGGSLEEVRRTGGKMKRFYDLMEKDARGTMTAAERHDFEILQQDRDVRRGLAVQEEIQGFRREHGQDRTAESAAAADDSQRDRIAARNDLNEDVTAPTGALAHVAPLTPVYAEAAAGNVRPQLPPPALQPAPAVAANTVQINSDNMFG
jgi:hypothetical protein